MSAQVSQNQITSWWAHRQSLLEIKRQSAESLLESAGWLRSVGGIAPYLSLFSRSSLSRAEAESELKAVAIHELPSARGCVHFLPAQDYRIGLSLAFHFGSDTGQRPACKHFGFNQEELCRLEDGVLAALADGPLDPKDLKAKLGALVRVFPPEAKKHGLTTSLPIALAVLQRKGRIRRIPFDGRLDGERYLYASWSEGPMAEGPLSEEDALAALASLYWRWIGAASLKHFQWFSGVSLTKCRKAVASLDLVEVEGTDLLMKEADRASLSEWQDPEEPIFRLVSSLDTILMGRRDLPSLLEEGDRDRPAFREAGVLNVGGLSDVSSHMIVDRGRIAGFWDYDPSEQRIVPLLWREPTRQYQEELERTESFIREELGDARSFSLDSPASRQKRLAFLRAQAGG